MYYNWEEIFAEKSNKELYNIYCGNSSLPESTIPFAKKELENRNFDFDNMEVNRAAWRLSSLMDEDAFFESQIKKLFYIPIKYYLLGVILLIIIFFFIAPRSHDSIYIGFVSFLLIGTIYFFSNNYLFKKQQEEIRKRRKEKLELMKKLKKKDVLYEHSPIVYDMEREKQKNSRMLERLAYVFIGVTLLLVLFRILINYSN